MIIAPALNPAEELFSSRKTGSVEVKVEADLDYVSDGYVISTFEEIAAYIRQNKPSGIPSTEEMDANGIELGEMNSMLLKIEEMTFI